MSRFISSKFDSLKPYEPGEQPTDKKYIKLNTNESPFSPSPFVEKAISDEEIRSLRLYPDPNANCLKNSLSKHYGVKKENIFIGNGSDEILALIFLAFCDEKTGMAFANITYSFYPVYCNLYNIKAKQIPVNSNFSINPRDYFNCSNNIIIANPNAPTGIALNIDDIESIIKNNKDRLVVVDEAYVDFGAKSCLPLIKKYDNLLIVRTFSKSRSLAGARIGYAFGNESLICDLQKVKFSFNSYTNSRLSLVAAIAALEDEDYFLKCRGVIIKTREKTYKQLKKLNFTLLPSLTNFIFAKPPAFISASSYYNKLKQMGILVRYFKNSNIDSWVRITIGSSEEMDTFIEKTNLIILEAQNENCKNSTQNK